MLPSTRFGGHKPSIEEQDQTAEGILANSDHGLFAPWGVAVSVNRFRCMEIC